MLGGGNRAAGVVCHFIGQVLPEDHALGIDSSGYHEQVGATDEVCKSLICDDALGDGIPERQCLRPGVSLLQRGCMHERDHISNVLESGMLLALRVHKVFNFSLRELPHSQQPLLRVDLVPEGLPDLCGCKRKAPAVVVQEVAEVHKDALRGLRAEISNLCSTGPDGRLEHEIEWERVRDLASTLFIRLNIPLQ